MKKLIGNSEMETALMRLDKLTNEEARLAITEIRNRVQGVDERVREVDERLRRVDVNVHRVDDKVHRVDDKVHGVDDKVDDKVTSLINGTSSMSRTWEPKPGQRYVV